MKPTTQEVYFPEHNELLDLRDAMMNFFLVSLHLNGDLPSNSELIALFGESLSIKRQGETLRNGKISPEDRAFLDLARWEVESRSEYEEGITRFDEIASVLTVLTPILRELQSDKREQWLRIGMVRRTDQGGITFPTKLMQAIANAGLFLHISITVILDDDDDDDAPFDNEPVPDPDGSTVLASFNI